SPDEPRYYVDYTGTGNSLNMRNPYVLQLIMDSLRYWITDMHVDGFRFDLAATLARELHDVDRLSAFFDLIQQDPVVREVKLIAEPWDVGEGGYQVGNFRPLWCEWNGKFRDSVRDFWRGERGTLGELGYRLTSSADVYNTSGRRPGNNNAYCQDSELSWFDWSLVEKNEDLVDLVAWLVALRRDHPVFRHRRWFQAPVGAGVTPSADIAWFSPAGKPMTDEEWEGRGRSLAVFLNGEGVHTRGSMVYFFKQKTAYEITR